MRNEERHPIPQDGADSKGEAVSAEEPSRQQQIRGVAGRLRPYRDVRAGFEPWRRLAMLAWDDYDDQLTVH